MKSISRTGRCEQTGDPTGWSLGWFSYTVGGTRLTPTRQIRSQLLLFACWVRWLMITAVVAGSLGDSLDGISLRPGDFCSGGLRLGRPQGLEPVAAAGRAQTAPASWSCPPRRTHWKPKTRALSASRPRCCRWGCRPAMLRWPGIATAVHHQLPGIGNLCD